MAQRAGGSRSTVSYALSGRRPVSPGTERRVQAVIGELGHRPDTAARALKEGRTRTIGLVIPPASRRPTGMRLDFVASVVDAAARADLDVLLSPSAGEHDRSFERVVTGRRVDGVILIEIRLEGERVARLRHSGLPFAGIGRTGHPEEMSWVDIDYETLIARCVEHLADLGHREVALVDRNAELVTAGYGPGQRAQSGFAGAVASRGLEGVQVCCADGPQAGQARVEQPLAARPGLTAIA
ncbi:LacI family DNA-binding transcriptional regulator [Streptosporangium sp. NPDC023615]|uniref:LacI family DNA-binding transcriptional regulator n=1 Tax=Streptosporangium sp. NPDC023615 TaxID=3154794 RepID=UPI00342A1192